MKNLTRVEQFCLGTLATLAAGAIVCPWFAQDPLAISDVPDSSLGREFTTEGGGLSGMLDGAGDGAKVTALWSGQACIFR